jgi:hypothetical protein
VLGIIVSGHFGKGSYLSVIGFKLADASGMDPKDRSLILVFIDIVENILGFSEHGISWHLRSNIMSGSKDIPFPPKST